MFTTLVFIWRLKPRPAGGQEEGYMFWSAHFMHEAPNSELGAQITRNPFRLTVSISLDFSFDWWVRTYRVIINKYPKVNKSRTNIKARENFFNAFK